MVPNASKATLKRLVAVANVTVDYVAAIERVVKRARYFAGKRGTPEPAAEDIKRAVSEIVPVQESSQIEQPDQPEPVESSSESFSNGRLTRLDQLDSKNRFFRPLTGL